MPTNHNVATYAHLLADRLTLGLAMIDHLSHTHDRADGVDDLEHIKRLLQRLEQLENALGRFARWHCGDSDRVFVREEERWHAPGRPPRGDGRRCRFCEAPHLHVNVPLPTFRCAA